MNDSSNAKSTFATPEAGQLPSGKQEFYPEIEYSTMKTPGHLASSITPEIVANARATFKLGFHYWDKLNSTSVAIDKFTFAVLEVYAAIEGSKETEPGKWINYFSNYVKNSRNEPFALFQKGIKRPIMKGFYTPKKDENDVPKLIDNGVPNNLPNGAGFHQHFILYWIEGDRIMDLPLTTMVSREIKESISRAEARAGRKVKPDRVNLFALADGGAFWGFEVTKFRRVNKDGTPHDGRSEMFLVPDFNSGVIKAEGDGANPELYAICAGHQATIRAAYEAEKVRRAKFGVENSTTEQTETAAPGNDANFPTDQQGGTFRQQHDNFQKRQDTPPADPFPSYEAPPPPTNFDDLPF